MMKTGRTKPLACIISAGSSKYGKRDGLYARELFAEAAYEAFDRCPNLDPQKDIDSVYVGQAYESLEHQANISPGFAASIGLQKKPTVRVESVSSSSATALRHAIFGILGGMYDTIMIGGAEKMTHRSVGEAIEIISMAADFPFEQWQGATLPGLCALIAREHMRLYGTTEEQMAKVAVKNHRNAVDNPKAQFRKEITIEEVMSSRIVADPLKLYDCSAITDGASCVIICKPEIARRYTDNFVEIIGTGEGSDAEIIMERESLTSFFSTKKASEGAYSTAKVEPKDLDFAEVHDAFTINEIIAYEDLGFCKKGEGGAMVDQGAFERDGKLPVNTSGGLKGKGHPVGASGAAQVYEAYLQLTDQAGKRQIQSPQIGLTHAMGGAGVNVVSHIFRRH